MPAARTRLVIIRHGESLATVNQVIGGHAGCTGLSGHGREQAEVLRDRLLRTGELNDASVMLTSVLPRAVETAEIIAPAIGGGALRIDHNCDLCELHPGESDGLDWVEFESRYGPPDWRADPHRPLSPGGESWASFMGRVGATLDRLATVHAGRTVVIVSHGGIVQGSMVSFLRLPDYGLTVELWVENTSLTEWRRNRPDTPWQLVRFADSAHI
jgi:probable phosphoglycerate mutase